MASNPIYPVAYTIKHNQVRKLYYLGFPEKWKKELLLIAQKNNPKYGLPTNTLKKMIDNWMDGIVLLRPLNAYSNDEQWLAACVPFTEKRIAVLFGIIKSWVAGTYISGKRAQMASDLARSFISNATIEDISALYSERDVVLSGNDGTVNEEAYQAIPLIAVNELLGKNIEVNGTILHLRYAAKNELISQPIEDPKSHHFYSYVFNFSVQTTPPDRHALLLCNMSIRRWVPGRFDKDKAVYSDNAINVHVYVGGDKYCQIPIYRISKDKGFAWKKQDKECYDLWGFEPLIDPSNLWEEIERGKGKYLLPYKNGMPSFTITKIGSGVPVKDKAELYQRILANLNEIVDSAEAAAAGPRKKSNLPIFKSPQEYRTYEDFRRWVAVCAETDRLKFEIYGLSQDPRQARLMDLLEEKLNSDFGCNNEKSALVVDIERREAGDMQTKLTDDSKNGKIKRCDDIVDGLGDANGVVACLFVIPGAEDYRTGGDPKQVIRNAFAQTGRVVQFIVPEDEQKPVPKQKIENAVYDLYRQLGVTNLLDVEKAQNHPYANVRCVGMHIFTQVHGTANKGRFLPIYVDVNLLSGKTRVQCSAFDNYSVSYREACIEMAKLFWKSDLEQLCIDACRTPAKQKLIELRNKHVAPENKVIFMATADGNSRPLWGGMSDKAIGEYEMFDEYIPKQIDVGAQKAPYYFRLKDSGVRIVRIRTNMEVPDYITERKGADESKAAEYSSASGVFKYGKTFWSIAPKPNDKRFGYSFSRSRIDFPQDDYLEKDMIELYPLQLQQGDDPWGWVRYVNALRQLPIQYSQATVLPLPLHLAKNLSEYLFDV